MVRRHLPVRGVAAVILAGLALAACSSSSPSPAPAASPSSALQQELRELVAVPGGPPGAIALIDVDGQVDVSTAGVNVVGSTQAITPDETVRIASISKAYSGAIALSLVSQGKLSLTATVGQLVPGLPADWAPVTLAQLLHHTSGVPDYIKSPEFLQELQADPHAQLTPMQLLGYVSDEPLLFPPGSRYDYSDSDNIIVGLMVEAVTGTPYASALARYVTGPLRTPATSLPDDATLPEPYVHGYAVGDDDAHEDVSTALNPALAWASGGMLSTAAGLDTFIRAYASGTLVDAAARAAQLQFIPGESGPPGPGTNSAGLGIFRYQTSCGTVYGHTGNFPGYTLFAAANPAGTRSAVVFVNQQLTYDPPSTAFTELRQADELAVCAALRP